MDKFNCEEFARSLEGMSKDDAGFKMVKLGEIYLGEIADNNPPPEREKELREWSRQIGSLIAALGGTPGTPADPYEYAEIAKLCKYLGGNIY